MKIMIEKDVYLTFFMFTTHLRPDDPAYTKLVTGLCVSEKVTLLPLPPYSPELSARTALARRLRRLIIDSYCCAWKALVGGPGRTASHYNHPWIAKVSS